MSQSNHTRLNAESYEAEGRQAQTACFSLQEVRVPNVRAGYRTPLATKLLLEPYA